MKPKVLFICTRNSSRSQMAEALLTSLYGDTYEAYSAGIEPTEVNPHVVRVMAEIGINISQKHSTGIEHYRGTKFDYVVTLCDHAKEICPFFPGEQLLHKNFKDPSKFKGSENKILEEIREIREEIKMWLLTTFKP